MKEKGRDVVTDGRHIMQQDGVGKLLFLSCMAYGVVSVNPGTAKTHVPVSPGAKLPEALPLI